VLPGQEARFLAPLDVADIPGVGKVTEQKLRAMGIRRVGDLAQFEEEDLEQRFGKWAWRWQGSRAAKMLEDGSMPRWESTVSRKRLAMSTPTTKIPAIPCVWNQR